MELTLQLVSGGAPTPALQSCWEERRKQSLPMARTPARVGLWQDGGSPGGLHGGPRLPGWGFHRERRGGAGKAPWGVLGAQRVSLLRPRHRQRLTRRLHARHTHSPRGEERSPVPTCASELGLLPPDQPSCCGVGWHWCRASLAGRGTWSLPGHTGPLEEEAV